MLALCHRMLHEDDGVLSFEWVLLTTLLTFGIVGALSAARDALIDELGDTAQVMTAVDQSYHVGFPLQVLIHNTAVSGPSDSDFTDALFYSDCDRSVDGQLFIGQDFVIDGPEIP